VLFVAGCALTRGGGRVQPASEAACRSLDSAFAHSGWQSPMALAGRVQLDVKQYRVKGRFRADFDGEGDFTFEFEGTMVMGGHHEDVVVSFHGGELYVLDRERGRLYQGEETDELLREGLGVDWHMADLVRRITARPPPCARLSGVEVESGGRKEVTAKGRIDGGPFRADFKGGLIERASWPVGPGGRAEDRLSLEYRWRRGPGEPARLEELVAFLEGRRWRLILQAE
jgi:hypothetical protein